MMPPPLAAIAGTPEPHPLIMVPFAAMLLCIAVAPLVLKHHWERSYRFIAVGLSAITCSYYAFVLRDSVPLRHAVADYLSFIVVVGSFFVVAGGIHISVKGEARPLANLLFLAIGALLANVVGTVGASMLLIRPWISMNRYRFTGFHTAFFIFVVSNVGALLPTGPPLVLGYFKGVPFTWPLRRCWLPWSVMLGLLLAIFYFADRRNYRRAPVAVRHPPTKSESWRVDGSRNFALMLVILLALTLLPSGWREATMLAAAIAAYFGTPPAVFKANEFSFAPIKEVAWLFLGIFGTMPPVLQYMEQHAASLGLRSDAHFFWFSGILSALLDNAPTYLAFVAAAFGLHGLNLDRAADMNTFLELHDSHLVAVSLGATFFGALTYIGNGPNLLVKAIADHAHVRTPTFFGYVFKFALPVLLPILALITILFFRG